MRKYLLTAAAAAAIATPAAVAARDHSGYVGIEGGIMWPNKADLHVDANGSQNQGGLGYYLYYSANNLWSTNLRSKYKTGLDVDAPSC